MHRDDAAERREGSAAPILCMSGRDHAPRNRGSMMSALGQKQTLQLIRSMSALPPKADIGTQPRDVRFVPEADIRDDVKEKRPPYGGLSKAVRDVRYAALDF